MRVASQNQSQRSRKSSRGRKGRTGSSARVSGIHNRRDKRFFCDKPRPTLEDAVHQSQVSDVSDESPATDGGRSAWNEAIMLWLSWNRTYEKATACMYQDGNKDGNKKKLRAMFDEMEFLRKQAIEVSQGLLSC
jgi:hypothetical protein